MRGFDADAFLDAIRNAHDNQDVSQTVRSPVTNAFDVRDFLNSIVLARQVEALEATHGAGLTVQVDED